MERRKCTCGQMEMYVEFFKDKGYKSVRVVYVRFDERIVVVEDRRVRERLLRNTQEVIFWDLSRISYWPESYK
jgi:hypothetical protein